MVYCVDQTAAFSRRTLLNTDKIPCFRAPEDYGCPVSVQISTGILYEIPLRLSSGTSAVPKGTHWVQETSGASV